MNAPHSRLHRELGLAGAVLLGLGAMVGTGVFVSIGIAAGHAGASVVLAIVLAAALATCNALSSAQLAASHPVSGGTYEYGYRYLSPWMGFTAGWMFLCAKSASAAAAALGFAGYLLAFIGDGVHSPTPLALFAIVLLTVFVLGGLRHTNRINAAIVSTSVLALAVFVVVGLSTLGSHGASPQGLALAGTQGTEARGFLYASALMFVAFTGYGRIATLGEEVRDPRRTIPRAIIATVVIATLLYVLVAVVIVGAGGNDMSANGGDITPIDSVAVRLGAPWLPALVSIGAISAMLGVLLNLVLGLSRVVLAMGRRGDLPAAFARLHGRARVPVGAVVGVALAIAALALTGSVETTWAFSAFTVLVYYAITNLAALRLPVADRRYPPAFAVAGLLACVFLAFQLPVAIWTSGLALIGIGLGWHWIAMRLAAR